MLDCKVHGPPRLTSEKVIEAVHPDITSHNTIKHATNIEIRELNKPHQN